VVSLTIHQLYPWGKIPWYPSNRRLGGPQSRSGCLGKELNLLPPLGFEPRFTVELLSVPLLHGEMALEISVTNRECWLKIEGMGTCLRFHCEHVLKWVKNLLCCDASVAGNPC
jgi:hypothetical protein